MFFNGFPGGFPGGFGGNEQQARRPEPEKEVDTEKFYKLLGVDKNATPAQIKKGFRKMAMKHHPDKGGSEELFKEISRAYEVLSDEEKRQNYDEYGEEGIDGPPGGEGMDIFDLFGGGGRRRGGRQGKRKGEDVQFTLSVALQDMYKGVQKRLRLTRNIKCKGCNGKGHHGDANQATCRGCKGQGVRTVIRQIGPGMIQQMRGRCDMCDGTGQTIAAKDRCRDCRGTKVQSEKKELEVYVERGMGHGSKSVFHGESHQLPNTIPGDVIVTIKQKPHPVFRRDGRHLFIRKTLSLSQALCGFQISVTHLDGRELLVKSDGKCIKPGDFRVIREEGMPIRGRPHSKGDLYVEFDVEFPTSFTAAQQKKLLKVLGSNEDPTMKMGDDEEGVREEVEVQTVNMEHERQKIKRDLQEDRTEHEQDEDDERQHHRGHHGAECRAQ